MAEEFVRYFQDDIAQIQLYAQEHRSGNDRNRRELDRCISIMLRRFHPSVERSLRMPHPNSYIEQRRQTHLMWKNRFLRFTDWIKYLVMGLTMLFLLAVWYFGSGSDGAKIAYRCFFAAAVVIACTAWAILYKFKQSTKEFLIEHILRYPAEEL